MVACSGIMSRYDPALVATFLLVLDLCGTFVFALSGAMSGVKHRLDLFGVLVLSFAAGTAGGIIRDVLLGVEPPPAIRDWRYIGSTRPGSRSSRSRARSRPSPSSSTPSRRCCSGS
jgi:hypothetical protein